MVVAARMIEAGDIEAALVVAGEDGRPLVEDHSVIAPLSAALLLQHLDSARLDAKPRIGIVADPVYSAEDPRVVGSMRPRPADAVHSPHGALRAPRPWRE